MTKKSTSITFTPKRIQKVLNDIYRHGGEHILKGFARGQLNTADANDIYESSKNGHANWPTVNLSQSDNDILMNISSEGTILHQEHLAVEKPKTEEDQKHSIPKIAQIMSYLNTHVIGQDNVKKVCARAIKQHFERCFGEASVNGVKLKKKNVLVSGPSGAGKTEIWRKISEYFETPVFIIDASLLTKPGHKGYTPEDLARDIWLQCEKDMEKTKYAIVVLDEFDKLACSEFQRDTLNSLLKFIEGGKIPFKENAMSPDTQYLDTTEMLIVALGAFEGIEQMPCFVEKGGIGFGAENTQTYTPSWNEIADKISVEHYVAWGFNKQVLGRFPVRICAKELIADELFDIQLNVPGSVYHQWKELFARLDSNVELEFTTPALKLIADQSIKDGTGARELDARYDAILGDAYDEAEMDENISSVKVYVEKGELKVQYGYGSSALETLCKHIPVENSEA